MTKNKTRKMTKSTFAIIIMGIAMVAMLAFGGTFAYFTASTQSVSSTSHTGTVKLSHGTIAGFHSANIVSGDTVTTGVTFDNYSDVNTFAVVKFSVTLGGAEVSNSILNYALAEGWQSYTFEVAEDNSNTIVYLIKALDARSGAQYDTESVCGAITFNAISKMTETYHAAVADDPETDENESADAYYSYAEVNQLGASNATLAVMGQDVVITFQAWAVQQDNLVLTAAQGETPAVYVDPTPKANVEDTTHDGITDAEALVIVNTATGNSHVAHA